jgi:hypothetical protein
MEGFMTEWDRLVLREAGILAVLAFVAMVAVAYFGDDIAAFWRFIGWLAVLAGGVRIGIWLSR